MTGESQPITTIEQAYKAIREVIDSVPSYDDETLNAIDKILLAREAQWCQRLSRSTSN